LSIPEEKKDEEISSFFKETLASGKGIMVSDALVKDGHGAFAWILTDPLGKKIIVRKKVSQIHDKLTSYRAEGCGVKDMTQFLRRQKFLKRRLSPFSATTSQV